MLLLETQTRRERTITVEHRVVRRRGSATGHTGKASPAMIHSHFSYAYETHEVKTMRTLLLITLLAIAGCDTMPRCEDLAVEYWRAVERGDFITALQYSQQECRR